MFREKFIAERKTLKVSYLKKTFFFLNVVNKKNQGNSFRLSVNDEDEDWIKGNPLSSGE